LDELNTVTPFEPEEKLHWEELERSSMLEILDQMYQEMQQKDFPSELESLLLDKLTPRQLKVLLYRFGFVDGHSRTLEETGALFGVTRERIRQIESMSLRRLYGRRHRAKKLRDYLNG